MSNVKDYAKQINSSYNKALNRLKNQFDAMAGAIEEEYLARNREIDKKNLNSKNALSADYKIGLENARGDLLDRGLAVSGEAVNTEIRSNLSKNQAFAALDAQAEAAKVENALSRTNEKAKLINTRLQEERELSESRDKALKEQYNADREYELEISRDAEDTRRWEQEQKNWEQEQKNWEQEQERKSAEADREHDLETMKFLSDEDQRKKDYNLDSYKVYLQYASKDSEDSAEGGSGEDGSGEESDGGSIPNYSADELVDSVFISFNRKDFKNESARNDAIKRAINGVINDTSIDKSYREEVRIYAKAMGYI